jgi:hypothetical protein
MKIIGLGSYGYSIWTNVLGIQHMFGFDPLTTYILAGAMDILPENMIAWGLGTTLDGGVIDNLLKGIIGRRGKSNHQTKVFQTESRQEFNRTFPTNNPNNHSHKNGKNRRAELESQRQKEKPNRFGLFGE